MPPAQASKYELTPFFLLDLRSRPADSPLFSAYQMQKAGPGEAIVSLCQRRVTTQPEGSLTKQGVHPQACNH